VSREFTRRRVELLRGRAKGFLSRLLDEMEHSDKPGDFVAAVSSLFQELVIDEFLGAP
jgi:cytochrome P450